MLERGGDVITQVIPNPRKKTLQKIVRENVLKGCGVYTDALASCGGLEDAYAHYVIDHAVSYVEDHVHTIGMEKLLELAQENA